MTADKRTLDNFLDRREFGMGSYFVVRTEELLSPLGEIVASSSYLSFTCLESEGCESGGRCQLPRYHFEGEPGGGDRIRIGVFGGIHGDEPAGSEAAVEVVRMLQADPELARGYSVWVYPVCNPGGFEDGTRCSRSGKDLNREFWIDSGEPEVGLLEADIKAQRFHGLISLHADDTSDGVYGYVQGSVLTRALLEPALRAAAEVLPLNGNRVIDGFPAEEGIISECYDGILTSPRELVPAPFEIILETPATAELELQVAAMVAGTKTVMEEYSRLLAFAANL